MCVNVVHTPMEGGTMIEVVLNDDLEWSRGKRAAHAAHAVIHKYGIRYTHAIRVLNAKPRDIPSLGTLMSERVAYSFDKESNSLTIYMAIRKSDTRDMTATAAAYAALDYYRVKDVPLTVSGGTLSEIETCPTIIRDAGRTELDPGTVTAGARCVKYTTA